MAIERTKLAHFFSLRLAKKAFIFLIAFFLIVFFMYILPNLRLRHGGFELGSISVPLGCLVAWRLIYISMEGK